MTFSEGSRLLYMKVGTHAKESLADILERKQREIDAEGFSMWGYGGSTCHPMTMVQPFANTAAGPIILCMQRVNSRHFAEPLRAEEYSSDGRLWKPVPEGINVLGSRYALCIDSLDEVAETLHLADTRVAVGRSRGRSGIDYVKGRVDKACLEIVRSDISDTTEIPINVTARIISPYAVFLRG
jgi:hypothetical protein